PVLVQMLDRLESEILADRVSEESRRWLASCGLTVEQMQNQMDPVYTPARKIHLYHCDHRGLPLALISTEGATEWCAEYDEWGNLLNEENPHQLQQLIRLPVLVQMLDRLESEILADRVSEESRRWLASCGLTVEQMQNQMDPVYTPARKIHLYHCDHRGLPLALISTEGATEWCAEYDEWGNLLNEENPHQLQQLIRLPGQQYDEESGLYYNRHRYYDPLQGRYITQDPIGLKGGWNFYQYPLNPVQYIDSMGLASKYGHLNNGGYGARPNKPPTPDPSKLPDIAKQLRLPYPIDQASSAPNVFKTFFRALSPYDYTLYCRKWVKPNLTCTPQDDSQYPGMDTKTASDYLPQTNWPTTQLPPGYTCAEPYLFPDINKPDGPATAGIDDLGEILAKMKQRTSRGIRE
ncbi:RHS domain-containing protein, partial [Escherichia coli]|nr:RHS domain-containing protein [Escherichia coli]